MARIVVVLLSVTVTVRGTIPVAGNTAGANEVSTDGPSGTLSDVGVTMIWLVGIVVD